MIIACATNQGTDFVSCHFGDAEKFYIYEINDKGFQLIEILCNDTSREEPDAHGDPKKAKGITGMLKEKNVDVLMSMAFGPNIKKIVKHFIPVLSSGPDVNENLNALCAVFQRIEKIADKKSGCTFYNLKDNKEVKVNV
jgi:predicted Fe-Mo cluster-binding NifX family protein